MNEQRFFIDSNVWLYRFLVDREPEPQEYDRKRKIAIKLTNVRKKLTIINPFK
jgi:predicted nucleic acid-binding protein